jgi:plastocyanin
MATTHPVKIKNMKFAPASVTVASGDAVEWTNEDGMNHTATANDGSFDSGQLAQNDRFSQVFQGPARTVAYHCANHPGMKGNVVVS